MRMLSAVLVLSLLCMPVGCGPETPTPNGGKKTVTVAEMKDLAFQAGQVASLTYLAIQKPSKEDAAKIKVVIDFITKTVNDWPEGGFKSTIPALNALIDKEIPVEKNKALNLLCKQLGETLMTELDRLFDKHPEWKKKGSEVAGIVGSFTTGAAKGFDDYIKP
jgi:hypothetical protein